MSRPSPTFESALAEVSRATQAQPGIKYVGMIQACMEALECSRSIACRAITTLRETGEIYVSGRGYYWIGSGHEPDDRVRRTVRAADVQRVGGVRLSPIEWSVRQMGG